MDVKPFRLPAGLRVVMGDIAAGSATPAMVKSVLKWKASGSDAEKLWEELGKSNARLIDLFNQIKDSSSEDVVFGAKGRKWNDHIPSKTENVLRKIAQEFHVSSTVFAI